MMKDENAVALSIWAVTCDALARGEQTFHLVADVGAELEELEHREFWLAPDWAPRPLHALTEPYQDRLRALQDLRHDDGRVRLKYYATVEYVEPLQSAEDLHGLDGDHTLRRAGVQALFRRAAGDRSADGSLPGEAAAGSGPDARVGREVPRASDSPRAGSGGAPAPVSLLVLRVYERSDSAVLDEGAIRPDRGPRWLRLAEPISTDGLQPVVEDDRFVSRKARLLQRTGAIRTV